jgi:hypothetical protein
MTPAPQWHLDSEGEGDTIYFSDGASVLAVENELGVTPDSMTASKRGDDVNKMHWNRKLSGVELERVAQAFHNLGLSKSSE